ncbi:M15 family metallopeptidase [Aquabacter sp. CN5-332]|uniref:M15 family metallopeptidase n=1 Tax=Aquabacter sp. CN5-332 TaxID=3156608 RepID=UPI0032B59D94
MDRQTAGAAFAVGLASLSPTPTLSEIPSAFVDVAQVVPDAQFDVRYFTTDNFVGARVDGYEAHRCFLTLPAAQALRAVAEEAARNALRLLIFDCYRPARAVAHFARWAADLSDEKTKLAYYPDVEKRDLFAEGYIAEHSGHSRGSTLDLTLVNAASGRQLDMGTPFDLFGPRSWPSAPDVTPEQRANRRMLAGLMERNGFKGFDKEWWHFTLKNEPFPDTYFDFPIR